MFTPSINVVFITQIRTYRHTDIQTCKYCTTLVSVAGGGRRNHNNNRKHSDNEDFTLHRDKGWLPKTRVSRMASMASLVVLETLGDGEAEKNTIYYKYLGSSNTEK